ncbi:hypothetical protein HBB16_21110 [Pseudonocardia sp. MCCB 268]|nr:hypothetical protein [Pseudonocardia cytotoxica]
MGEHGGDHVRREITNTTERVEAVPARPLRSAITMSVARTPRGDVRAGRRRPARSARLPSPPPGTGLSLPFVVRSEIRYLKPARVTCVPRRS